VFPLLRSSEKHFLHYKFTVLTRTHTFPEFSGVCVYDDRRIKHFSKEERVWIKESAHDWTNTLEEPADSRDFIIRQIRTLSDCTHSLCPGEIDALLLLLSDIILFTVSFS